LQSYEICSTYTEILATQLDEFWTQDVQLRLNNIFRDVLWTHVVEVSDRPNKIEFSIKHKFIMGPNEEMFLKLFLSEAMTPNPLH
jgi:hypothetical protein